MKIKMTKQFQGRFEDVEINPMFVGQEYSVGKGQLSQSLADWLIKFNFAVASSQHYGSQVFEGNEKSPLRHDDELAEDVKEVVTSNDFEEVSESLNKEIDATSAALKLAEKENIDITKIEGTGSNGRITLSDVENFLNEEE